MRAKKFLDLTLDCFCHQHVNEPTRGENILDLVLTSCESMVDNLVVHEQFANSYHNFITFDLSCDASVTYWMELYHDIRRGNFKASKNELGLINWLEIFHSNNADEMCLVYKNRLNDVVFKNTPIRRKRRSNKRSWWSKNIDSGRKREKTCWYDYKLSQNHSHLLKYKKCLCTATKTIRNVKRSYEIKLSLHIKDDPKAFYKYARSKTKMKDTVGAMIDNSGNVIPADSANEKLLNEYLASIFTKENLLDIPMYNKASYINALNIVDFADETVYDTLCKLRVDKSPGVDGIIPVVQKNLPNVISKPLSHIFNQSL